MTTEPKTTRQGRALDRLFNPRGIAIVGATGDLTRTGGQTVRALVEYGYAGGIYPVNPRHPEIAGRRCYASLAEVDGDCDVAVVALPAPQVPGIIQQCGDRGIPFAVVIGSGFRETGAEGARIEAEMLAVARKCGVRFIGPNGLGLINVHTRAIAAFGSLTRPPDLKPGAVSAVIQSGGFGNSLVISCGLAGVGFRYVVASGNETDITAPELIDAYVDDPHTRVILAYLEGVADGRAFMAAANRALAAGKPIIAWKAGNTKQGSRAAASHTANMTGTYDMYRAAFRQCGVIEVHDVEEAADTARCLLTGRLPSGRNVALIGGSGGSAVVFSDTADEVGLTLPALSSETIAILKESLPSNGSLKNPVDYTAGYPRPESRDKFARAFEALLSDPNVDQLAVMFATAFRRQLHIGSEILREASKRSNKPIVVFSVMPEDIAPEATEVLDKAEIPVLRSPGRVCRAMARMAGYAEALRRRGSTEPCQNETRQAPLVLPSLAGMLDEHQSKQLLSVAGVPVTRDAILPIDGPYTLPKHLAFPVVLKIVSPDIAHKTEVGGVQLGISNAEQLAATATGIVASARRAAPQARLSGLLVSEMVTDGVEAIVGVVNDKGFGPVVGFGLGGVLAETLQDMTYRLAPFGREEARLMVREIRAHAIFDGLRGRPACDVDALAEVLAATSQLAWQMRDRLAEMDVNPLIVRPRGLGVVAADALMVLKYN